MRAAVEEAISYGEWSVHRAEMEHHSRVGGCRSGKTPVENVRGNLGECYDALLALRVGSWRKEEGEGNQRLSKL